MKIALDLRRINNPGIGRYMKCLAEAVLGAAPENEYLLLLPPWQEEMPRLKGEHVRTVFPDLPCYSLREQIELPRLLLREKVDVLHTPHFNLPLLPVCPVVVTIHDVIYMACPQDLPSRAGRLYYRGMMRLATLLAKRILTDSEFSRRDIAERLHCDPAKIEVVYPAVEPGFSPVVEPTKIERVLSRYGIGRDFILYTGIYKPRKNHAALFRAFQLLVHDGVDASLVIAGPLGECESILRNLGRDLGFANRLIVLGFVPDDDLQTLYSAARVYACPSLYEGFGFTVLEAMACGTPVVCSPETSLPEVAGEAAVYADPGDPERFAAALQRVFFGEALRSELIAKGFANTRRFSWERTAAQALDAYGSAAGVCRSEGVCLPEQAQ